LARRRQRFPDYESHFANWALESSGMLQLSVWTALRELGIGASLQHFNDILKGKIPELFHIPKSCRLLAEMPYGGIGCNPGEKIPNEKEKRFEAL